MRYEEKKKNELSARRPALLSHCNDTLQKKKQSRDKIDKVGNALLKSIWRLLHLTTLPQRGATSLAMAGETRLGDSRSDLFVQATIVVACRHFRQLVPQICHREFQ